MSHYPVDHFRNQRPLPTKHALARQAGAVFGAPAPTLQLVHRRSLVDHSQNVAIQPSKQGLEVGARSAMRMPARHAGDASAPSDGTVAVVYLLGYALGVYGGYKLLRRVLG